MDTSSNQPTTVMQQPMVYQHERKNIGEKHKHIYKRLGIIEICLGASAITLAIINIIISTSADFRYGGDLSVIGSGIWGGVMILICGVLGRISWKKPRHCPIIASMVLTIVSSPICLALLGLEISAATMTGHSRYWCTDYSDYGDSYTLKPGCVSALHALTVFHAILAAIGLAAFVTAIVHSAYCCASVCCGRKKYQPFNVVYTTANLPQQAGVQIGVQYYPQVHTQYPGVPQQYVIPQQANQMPPQRYVTPQQANQMPPQQYVIPQQANQMPPPQASAQGPSQPTDFPPPYAPTLTDQQPEEKRPL